MKQRSLFIGLGLAWLAGAPALAGAHPFDVPLRDEDGREIIVGATPATPYSPKKTCGGCHDYESSPAAVTKQQTVGGTVNPSYDVKVATHGTSAGFHFQQGMNVAWGQVQRTFYKVASFTSSPGMVGKY